ncbi:uncharacterized protein LOC116207500 isoform X2 [Punica granatum]|uniref:Uncharacterized protein LOC116207500 isoform X2 n=2 Tax=Punica granatum TaxID=22663 RepID=A0A6P8DVR2_PUNGR|nr:uncharacterized protein LOC116207500 isoform X2 [Punica granatum]
MELARHSFTAINTRPPTLFSPSKALFKPTLSLPHPAESHSRRLALAQTLQSETLKILEWGFLCKQLSPFTSTSMGFRATEEAAIPIGETLGESVKLLDQTAAAVYAAESGPWDFSGIEDVTPIIEASARAEMLTVGEICRVQRMLVVARTMAEKLEAAAVADGGGADSSNRYSPLLDILHECNYQSELANKIGFCIDCSLSIILDRASEDLEIIRSERKRNMEDLDFLLKEASNRVFRAGGIDKPLVTKRRARLCVGVRASHKYLLPEGIVLDVSGSGATYFMEPKEAVELNNMEVRLSNAERAEEMAILSLLTSEIAEARSQIKYLMQRFREIDLAFARAAYAREVNGRCPILSSCGSEHLDIEGMQHPLLLASQRRLLDEENGTSASRNHKGSLADFPVPIDIKVNRATRVVVISGPNTGGKTASMKTLGLASLMSKAGMYVPAKNLPRLPWFNLVLADIGDQQSLEQNLSTFSGHISRIRDILEVASMESLVLIDEIGSGTDPSEGVALSSSILNYLKDRVNLAIVTTHYADLTLLREKDARFENAAMEFSLETLKPTYRVLWGSTGDSNALNIAESIGFNLNIIERARQWVEKLKPEREQERRGLLYQSLMEEKNQLEAHKKKAKSLHDEIMDLHNEIQSEAEGIGTREKALMGKETRIVQQELKDVEKQINSVVVDFERQLSEVRYDEINSLIRKSESAIASILEAHQPTDSLYDNKPDYVSYTPKYGEQVLVKGLGNKLAKVVEAPGDDGTVLVQFGKVRVRVNNSDVRAIAGSRKSHATANSLQHLRRQASRSKEYQNLAETKDGEGLLFGPTVQTSKNTVDLRGMRVEEAALELDMAISSRGPHSVLFIIHGMGTGAVKERALEMLRNHPRVAKYEQESPLNYGCTVAYIRAIARVINRVLGSASIHRRSCLNKTKVHDDCRRAFGQSLAFKGDTVKRPICPFQIPRSKARDSRTLPSACCGTKTAISWGNIRTVPLAWSGNRFARFENSGRTIARIVCSGRTVRRTA